MADVTIDSVVEDAEVTGGEKIPVSDGGVPKAVTTDRIKDFILKRIAALSSANKVDTENDGVYLLKGGELKPVSAAVLAAAVMDYAFALAPVDTITGNETVSIKDSTVKKTLSLDMLKSWLTEGSVTVKDLKAVADSVANKVDKDEGKGLSEKNFSAEDKAKLDNLVSNAQPDWEQTDDTAPDFIRNKPNIPEGVIVDQVLDQNSSNAVANSVVANLFSGNRITGIDLNHFPVEVKEGIAKVNTALMGGAIPQYPNLKAPQFSLYIQHDPASTALIREVYILMPDYSSVSGAKWIPLGLGSILAERVEGISQKLNGLEGDYYIDHFSSVEELISRSYLGDGYLRNSQFATVNVEDTKYLVVFGENIGDPETWGIIPMGSFTEIWNGGGEE